MHSTTKAITTRQRILVGCAKAEAEDDLAFLVLHWDDEVELRLVCSIAPYRPIEAPMTEIGKILIMEVEELHRRPLDERMEPPPISRTQPWCPDPRRSISVLRNFFGRSRSVGYQVRLVEDAKPDNFGWLVEHWFDGHRQPGQVYNILGDRGDPSEVTTGELFLSEVGHPEGNPRAGVGALRRRFA